jgi:hypothetical protein
MVRLVSAESRSITSPAARLDSGVGRPTQTRLSVSPLQGLRMGPKMVLISTIEKHDPSARAHMREEPLPTERLAVTPAGRHFLQSAG